MILTNRSKILTNIENEAAPRYAHSFVVYCRDANLSANARNLIEDAANEKFVSIASIWETAIKISIGKMSLSAPFDVLFPHQLQINGFELLPVTVEHTSVITTLPFHHRDPFDRLLIAQAIEEKMTMVSVDAHFDDYGITRLW